MTPVRNRTAVRLIAAVAIGVAFAAYEDAFRSRLGALPSDFAQPWIAGQRLREGRNPSR
jgi:hypothetical protein